MKNITAFLALMTLLCCVFGKAQAMSCADPIEPVKEYDLIFKGKVLDKGWSSTTFKVTETYKGALKNEIDIHHPSKLSLFGRVDYKSDASYIIFAFKDEEGEYNSGSCSGGILLEDNKPTNIYPEIAIIETYKAQVDALAKLVEANPNIPQYLLKQAQFYEENNDYDLAANAYQKILSLPDKGGEYKDALTAFGRINYKMGKYEEAVKSFDWLKTARLEYETEALKYYQASLLKLGRIKELNGQKVNFSGLELIDIDLSNLDLSGADLSNTNMRNVVIKNSKFDNSNFSGSRSSELQIKNSSFKGSNFADANIQFPKLEDVDFTDSVFTKAQLAYGEGRNVDFKNVTFRQGKFFFREYSNIDLTNADFMSAKIHRLDGMNLAGTNLNNISTGNYGEMSSYENVDLSGVDLSGSDLRGIVLKNTKFVHANLSHANLTWTYNGPADLRGADFTGANLENALMLFAFYDCNTKFPKNFNPEDRYMIPVWEGCKTPRPKISFNGLILPLDGDRYKILPIGETITWGESPLLKNVDLSGADFRESILPNFQCKECNLDGAQY